MIAKVVRGRDVGGLLRYLYGPGRANEHVDPHLVASWDDTPAALEPAPPAPGARHDTRHLADLLNQPLAASPRHDDRPVWHCPVRVAPTDRDLTDAEWRDVARDILARTGLAPAGDVDACRWVAVRHAKDHIHLVVTLARQDGAPVRLSSDFYRVGEAVRAAERRLGLKTTAPRDRTAPRRPTRGEAEKATRQGRREPARVTLTREVRTAVAGAQTADEFLARLSDAGLLVRPRFSATEPDVVTGYAVALPGDRSRQGQPVWFGGAKLAPDLSWRQVAARWPGHATHANTANARRDGDRWRPRLSGAERATAWRDATRVVAEATTTLRVIGASDPDTASDVAHATGRVLSATARFIEGRRGGPLTEAADAFDRAARDLHGHIPPRTPPGSSLRSVARLLAATGRAARDEMTQALALIAALTELVDAVAVLRDTQARAEQARAARRAVTHLDRAIPAPLATSEPRLVHSRLASPVVPRSAPPPTTSTPSRRKVRP